MLDPLELFSLTKTEIASDVKPALGITFDSRLANENTAFVALPGENMHGREFMRDALQNGAPFIISDLPGPRTIKVDDPKSVLLAWAKKKREKSRVIGITGSAGKTTTRSLVAAVLQAATPPGNLNTLAAIACHLLSNPHPIHVLELGIDRPGEMAELVDLTSPDLGLVTSIGPSHLERLINVENVAKEKGILLRGRPGLVSEQAKTYFPHVKSYGFHQADYLGSELRFENGFIYQYKGNLVKINSFSLGVAQASLAALVIAEQFGIPLTQAIDSLREIKIPNGRMSIERGRFTLIDDSYNANPLSMKMALDTMDLFSGYKTAILGDMAELGADSIKYHRELGELAAKKVDKIIAIGKFASEIIGKSDGFIAQNAKEAAEISISQDLKGTILVKGSRSVGLDHVSEVLRAHL